MCKTGDRAALLVNVIFQVMSQVWPRRFPISTLVKSMPFGKVTAVQHGSFAVAKKIGEIILNLSRVQFP